MTCLYTIALKNGVYVKGFDIEQFISFVFIVLLIGLFVTGVVKTIIKSRKDKKAAIEELSKPMEELPITEIDARVLKKECFVRTYGVKMPESKKEFYITFLTFSGEIKRFSVEEDFYLSVEENIAGTIALIDGKFLDFYFEK